MRVQSSGFTGFRVDPEPCTPNAYPVGSWGKRSSAPNLMRPHGLEFRVPVLGCRVSREKASGETSCGLGRRGERTRAREASERGKRERRERNKRLRALGPRDTSRPCPKFTDPLVDGPHDGPYRGSSSHIRNNPLLGPYSRTRPRVLWWS